MDPYGLLDALSFQGAPDPYAIWGDPNAQRAIWEAHDAVSLAKALRGDALFLAVGDGTAGPFDPPDAFDGGEAWIQEMNLILAARLAQLRIPVTTDFYGPGTHTWPYEETITGAVPFIIGGRGPASLHHVIMDGWKERLYLLRYKRGNVAIEIGPEGASLPEYLKEVRPILRSLRFAKD